VIGTRKFRTVLTVYGFLLVRCTNKAKALHPGPDQKPLKRFFDSLSVLKHRAEATV
jgi:hypothetical protein